MLKKMFILSSLVLPLMTTPFHSQASTVDTTVISNWQIDVKPVDMVHTLDNKKVFILGEDSKVHIYAADGKKQGSIKVDKGVSAIDIAPRGELLYLANGNTKTFTSLAVSFTTPIDVTGSPFLGNANAPVVIALFSDFQ
jgi:hypothetical protein